jgi:cell wall-associated NlpC family hydrolase
MRASLLALCVTALGSAACSSTTTRALPVASLVDRAWQGEEPPPGPRARAAIAFAEAQLGRSYCWGGRGPTCFDCSGLVQQAWASAGVRLPRSSGAMGAALADVPLDEVRAGDILWWPGHVGIYAGQGWSIEALDSRHGIVRRPARNPYRALRPPGVD